MRTTASTLGATNARIAADTQKEMMFRTLATGNRRGRDGPQHLRTSTPPMTSRGARTPRCDPSYRFLLQMTEISSPRSAR